MPVKLKNKPVRNFCAGTNNNIETAIMKYITKIKMRVEILLSIHILFTGQISKNIFNEL